VLCVSSLPKGSLKNKASFSAPALLGTNFDLEPSGYRFVGENSQEHCQQLNSFLSPIDLNFSFPDGPIEIEIKGNFHTLNEKWFFALLLKGLCFQKKNESRIS